MSDQTAVLSSPPPGTSCSRVGQLICWLINLAVLGAIAYFAWPWAKTIIVRDHYELNVGRGRTGFSSDTGETLWVRNNDKKRAVIQKIVINGEYEIVRELSCVEGSCTDSACIASVTPDQGGRSALTLPGWQRQSLLSLNIGTT